MSFVKNTTSFFPEMIWNCLILEGPKVQKQGYFFSKLIILGLLHIFIYVADCISNIK